MWKQLPVVMPFLPTLLIILGDSHCSLRSPVFPPLVTILLFLSWFMTNIIIINLNVWEMDGEMQKKLKLNTYFRWPEKNSHFLGKGWKEKSCFLYKFTKLIFLSVTGVATRWPTPLKGWKCMKKFTFFLHLILDLKIKKYEWWPNTECSSYTSPLYFSLLEDFTVLIHYHCALLRPAVFTTCPTPNSRKTQLVTHWWTKRNTELSWAVGMKKNNSQLID